VIVIDEAITIPASVWTLSVISMIASPAGPVALTAA